MALKALTVETLIADQKERIERSKQTKENNSVIHFIEDINQDLKI